MKRRKRNSLILILTLFATLSGCNGVQDQEKNSIQDESTLCIQDSSIDGNSQIYECSYDNSKVNISKQTYSLYEDDFSSLDKEVFKAEDEEETEGESEDEDDPNIPFQAGPFEWWWIVIIVGVIALIFFIGWLIFFIWDRKDKKKYKKKH